MPKNADTGWGSGGNPVTSARNRMRASFGLPPEEPREEAYQPPGLMVGSAMELIGSEKLSEILKQGVKSGSEFFNLIETAEETDSLDELRERLKTKGYGDTRESAAFWDAARSVVNEIKAEHAKVKTVEPAKPPAPTITPAEAGRELDAIHRGEHGSIASPANKSRRRELQNIMRRGNG